jgi:hypothetical protein
LLMKRGSGVRSPSSPASSRSETDPQTFHNVPFRESRLRDFPFGSLADLAAALPNARFIPESGHHRKPSSYP